MTDGITTDDSVQWGRSCIAGTGIPAECVADRFRAGESIAALMSDYGLRQEQVEAALRHEMRRRRGGRS